MGGEVPLLRLVRGSVALLDLPAVGAARSARLDLPARAPQDGILFEHAATAVVLAVVVAGSLLQAVGAAMRKYYGGDGAAYWRSSKWWLAFLVTTAGGILALLVMPFVPVVIFVPVTTTVQVSANFFFGVHYFQETVHHFQVIGLVAACLGAVLVNMRMTVTEPWVVGDFWASCADAHFLALNAVWLLILACTRCLLAMPFHYAFVAGYTSTLTFICMRAVSSGLGDMPANLQSGEWWGAVVFGLGVFNLANIHVQQLMLRGQLSLVEALFGASQTLIGCTIGGIFFHEESIYDVSAMSAAFLCVFGLLLLAVPQQLVEGTFVADPCISGKPRGSFVSTPRGSRRGSEYPTPRGSLNSEYSEYSEYVAVHDPGSSPITPSRSASAPGRASGGFAP